MRIADINVKEEHWNEEFAVEHYLYVAIHNGSKKNATMFRLWYYKKSANKNWMPKAMPHNTANRKCRKCIVDRS